MEMNVKLGDIATKLILENEFVKIWDLTLNPGEATDWHKHLMDYIFVVTDNCRVNTEYIDGSVEYQNDAIGRVEYRKIDKVHRLVNVDNKIYKNIVIEIKASKE